MPDVNKMIEKIEQEEELLDDSELEDADADIEEESLGPEEEPAEDTEVEDGEEEAEGESEEEAEAGDGDEEEPEDSSEEEAEGAEGDEEAQGDTSGGESQEIPVKFRDQYNNEYSVPKRFYEAVKGDPELAQEFNQLYQKVNVRESEIDNIVKAGNSLGFGISDKTQSELNALNSATPDNVRSDILGRANKEMLSEIGAASYMKREVLDKGDYKTLIYGMLANGAISKQDLVSWAEGLVEKAEEDETGAWLDREAKEVSDRAMKDFGHYLDKVEHSSWFRDQENARQAYFENYMTQDEVLGDLKAIEKARGRDLLAQTMQTEVQKLGGISKADPRLVIEGIRSAFKGDLKQVSKVTKKGKKVTIADINKAKAKKGAISIKAKGRVRTGKKMLSSKESQKRELMSLTAI